MEKQIPAYLLKKYLKGHCTPQEEATVEEWYNSFEPEPDYVSFISDAQKRKLKNRIKSRIHNQITTLDGVGKRSGRVRNLAYVIAGIAASLLIAFTFIRHQTKPGPINEDRLITVTNHTPNIIEKVLSDGSHVWMMPGSQIKYNSVFTGNTRDVSLSGESFFEVTKNPARPFIITSKNLITKVWGTSFRVRDSGELGYADVTVVTGKVSVKLLHPAAFHQRKDEVMLYPNQQITYTEKQQIFTEQPKADMHELAIWKKPSITFDNKPLKEVIPVLNKAFNLNINTADDKINGYLLNADFNGMNFPQIMEILRKALDVNYVIKGQQIILTEDNNQ